MAGDVLATATASADAARIQDAERLNGKVLDDKAPSGEASDGTDQAPAATRSQSDVPAAESAPQREESQDLAPPTQSAPSGVGVRRRLARLGASEGPE